MQNRPRNGILYELLKTSTKSYGAIKRFTNQMRLLLSNIQNLPTLKTYGRKFQNSSAQWPILMSMELLILVTHLRSLKSNLPPELLEHKGNGPCTHKATIVRECQSK